MKTRIAALIPAFALAAASFAVPAQALVLTADGLARGFQLNLFVDQAPTTGFCCGPLGIATNSLGQIVIQNYAEQTNSVFNDVNGQHFSDRLSSSPFGSLSFATALTNVNGQLYSGDNDHGGTLVKVNPDGSNGGVVPGTAAGIAGHGIWTDPLNGHIISASDTGIWDIDPVTGASRQIEDDHFVDGVSISPDGQVVYGADEEGIVGWSYTGFDNVIYDSGPLGSTDGSGIIQNGPFAGQIVANSNDGTVWLIDPISQISTIIADSGSRGDYVGIDLNNGSLLLSQTDSVYRLTCPNCVFATPTSSGVPTPSSLALLISFMFGTWLMRRVND